MRLDRATGETLGLRDMRGQTRMGPGGRVFFWNPDGQFDIYRQVGTNRPSLVFDAPNPQGWYFDYDGASADGSLVVGQALREEPRAAGHTVTPRITTDGRLVAFTSYATNLPPGGIPEGSAYIRTLTAP